MASLRRGSFLCGSAGTRLCHVSVSVSSDIGEGTRTVVDSLTAIPLLGDERALGEVP